MNQLGRKQSGYNLVEVLIAMALLGTVMISIMTLFVMGRSNVYSGKQMTQAVAVGTMVMEDLSTMNRGDAVAFFGLGALDDFSVAGVEFTDSVRITTSPQTATPAQGTAYLNKWKALLSSQKFTDAKLTLVFTPIRPAGGATVANAPILRIRTVIEWNESQRARHVALDTVKTDRGKT